MGDFTLFGIPISFGTMIYQAIIFTVLVFILKKFVFKKLVNILDTRKQHIENQLQLTEKYKLDAQKNFEASEAILKQARADAREMMKHNENEAKLIIQDAKDKAKQILKEAKEEAFLSRSRSLTQNGQIKGA
ncbi:ATP synthase subunit b [Neobacillus rhizosphaerae]|uniref:ATP synthase subunit b n=1 Tax=Neobacillus rhizosphaerae TaxID=2880965 RepID=A0ABM9ELZ7_9BACI|nr:ATP synthase F0 subunit B [Neobacillus rhizosphaerae]CAH2713609.1 ATP synthase subunit b [Neobacillus rhizosphaerae]